jgi:hypothetical protein
MAQLNKVHFQVAETLYAETYGREVAAGFTPEVAHRQARQAYLTYLAEVEARLAAAGRRAR